MASMGKLSDRWLFGWGHPIPLDIQIMKPRTLLITGYTLSIVWLVAAVLLTPFKSFLQAMMALPSFVAIDVLSEYRKMTKGH